MNDLSTAINKGEGGLKENPPCTPLKEKKGTSIFSVPVPVPIARTYTPAQGTPPPNGTGTGTGKPDLGTGTGTECISSSGTGTGKPSLRTGTGTGCLRSSGTGTGASLSRPTIDSKLILHGYHEQGRYDAVQTTLYVFRVPTVSNGYNNARILRYYLRRLGEENFRQIVYQQWRENDVDGEPRSKIAALMRKLWLAAGGAE